MFFRRFRSWLRSLAVFIGFHNPTLQCRPRRRAAMAVASSAAVASLGVVVGASNGCCCWLFYSHCIAMLRRGDGDGEVGDGVLYWCFCLELL